MDFDRIPPQNLDSEMAVLGAMLLDRDSISLAVEKLKSDSFYSEIHRKLFNHIISLYDENKPVDILTLTEKLKNQNEIESVGGASYVASIINCIPTTANLEHYIKIVKDKHILRRLIDVSSEIAGQCYETQEEVDEILDSAERKIFDIAEYRTNVGMSSFRELVKSGIETVETLFQHKRLVTGLSTGFSDFDKMTSGLQSADLIVFAARPSMGKTSLVLNIAEHVAVHEKIPVAIFSLEMNKTQLVMRMLCSHSKVNLQRVRSGFLAESDFPRLVAAAGKLASAPIYIDDSSGFGIMELRAKARRLKSNMILN